MGKTNRVKAATSNAQSQSLAQLLDQVNSSALSNRALISLPTSLTLGSTTSTTGATTAGPPPSATLTTSTTKPLEGTDMPTTQTNERRSTPVIVRICDLVIGDILLYSANINVTGTVEQDNEPERFRVNWSDSSNKPDNPWVAAKSDTTMLKNWCPVSPRSFAVFSSANPVAVTAGNKGIDFDSVILHKDKKRQILDAISQVDNHDLIFNQWGFADIFEKGTAISLLFYGPPGTGKTLMAQAIADKFNYKLQMVSTAEIETPEPGGAERNLKKYFAEAQKDKTVLLFDECDSLITDRKHVGMILAAQINALLSELERFTGIAIFTTNRLETLDPAFDRRLSLKLEFPMPDQTHRVQIWRRMFPAKAPLAKDIRWEDLATIEIAGGHIKNVVLKAARMAAAQKATQITDDILWDCLESEVEGLTAYREALESNKQVFGTALPNAGRDLVRQRGKTQTRG